MYGTQGYIDWIANPILGIDAFHRVHDLTDFVYQRLLARPRMPLQGRMSIHTLSYNSSINIPHGKLQSIPEPLALQTSTNSTHPTAPIQQGGNAGDDTRSHDTLMNEIDEYLLSLNLDGLPEQDRNYMSQGGSYSNQPVLGGPGDETTDIPLQDTEETSERRRSSDTPGNTTKRFRVRKSFFKPSGFGGFGMDPLSSIGLAAGMLQFVDTAAKISFNISTYYRSVRDAPRELKMLSNRLMQYSGLLQIAAETIRNSMPAGELQDLGWEILKDSKETMLEVEKIVGRFKAGHAHQIARALKWQSNKTSVVSMMEEVESLKSTLSVMLQLYQVKSTERSLGGVTQLSSSNRDLFDLVIS
jgi:hypothetical protein